MPPQCIRPRKSLSAAPLLSIFQIAFTHKLLDTRVQLLVAFAVVLPRKGFAARVADEGPFVGMRAFVGAQVIGAREGFGTQRAVEV